MSTALDSFCGTTFWNSSYLDRADPDLPVCVERTVLVWVPLGFLWVCAPWHIATLFKKRAQTAHLSRLYRCKQEMVSLLFLTAVASLAVTVAEDFGPLRDETSKGKNPAVLYTNPVLYAISWLLVLACQESVRRQGKSGDSGTLFLFWILSVLCEVFAFQTLLREALAQGSIPDVPRFCLFYISYGLQVICLILSSFADVSPESFGNIKKD